MDKYTKTIDDIDVSVSYLQSDDETQCVVSFHNTSAGPVVLNPASRNHDAAHLFVGYVQLFGYVVLNYGFGLDDKSNLAHMDSSRSTSWWGNKEYVQHYMDPDTDVFERLEKLTTVPFIYENSVDQLVVGGKLGGVGDLVMEEGKMVDSEKRYLLHDLIYNFGTYKPRAKRADTEKKDDGAVPLKDLTDNILPFLTTSQSLLFTDLSLGAGEEKKFKVCFPAVKGPPTYNAFSTGITGEQGLISIRYSMVVGFQSLAAGQLKPLAVYYPLVVRGERKGRDPRWLQEDYLQTVVIDKSWQAEVTALEGDEVTSEPSAQQTDKEEDKLDSKSFFEDLDSLIESDLQHIPRVSTTERRKSVNSVIETEGLIPQLPSHMKNQYNLLMNNHQVCKISFSRAYYHIGEDLMFNIHLNTNLAVGNKIIGLTAHLEAHENFHMKNGDTYTNVYGVSPTVKYNTLAPTMLNLKVDPLEQEPAFVNGALSIARHLTQQFQCTKLMSLRYFIVFKFNLMAFDKEPKQEGHNLNASDAGDANSEQDENQGSSNGHSSTADAPLLEPSVSPEPVADPYEFTQLYWYDNYGNQFTFRLPIVILP